MTPPTYFDADGRRVAPDRGPRGRVLVPVAVLCVLGTAWNGDPMTTVKAAAVLLLVAAVVVWVVRPLLERGDRT